MKIALLADIHGNSIAFDAVMDDIAQRGGVDAFWLLGDLVALGPDPVGVLERIKALPGLRVIRGNTDRYTVTGDRPGPGIEAARADTSLLPALVEVSSTFAWTQGMITAGGWLEWLKALPLEMRVELEDGTSFLGVHASPGEDDGSGIQPEAGDAEIAALVANESATLIAMGHTHLPLDRRWKDKQLVNPGAVSLSRIPGGLACYAVLDGSAVNYRQVAYDHRRVIDQLNELNHPAKGFIIKHLGGRR